MIWKQLTIVLAVIATLLAGFFLFTPSVELVSAVTPAWCEGLDPFNSGVEYFQICRLLQPWATCYTCLIYCTQQCYDTANICEWDIGENVECYQGCSSVSFCLED